MVNKKSKKFYFVFFLCLLVVVVGISTMAITLSKYVLTWKEDDIVQSTNFYFVSDYLTEEGQVYNVTAGTTTFSLLNNDGLNITSEDISYTIEKTGGGSLNVSSGYLTGGVAQQNSVTLTGNTGESVTVQVKTSKPYSKTLKATFVFQDVDSYYTVIDEGSVVIVNLSIGENVPSSIVINYGSGLAPDNTDSLMSSWINTTSGTLTGLSKHSSLELYFFKTAEKTYTNVSKTKLSNAITL